MKKIQIYKLLDHVYREPKHPVYKEIKRKGAVIGYKLENPIHFALGSFVTANISENNFAEMYGFRVPAFLLKSVGQMSINNLKYLI